MKLTSFVVGLSCLVSRFTVPFQVTRTLKPSNRFLSHSSSEVPFEPPTDNFFEHIQVIDESLAGSFIPRIRLGT